MNKVLYLAPLILLVVFSTNPFAYNPMASTPLIQEAYAANVVEVTRYKDYELTDYGNGVFTQKLGLPEYVLDSTTNTYVPTIIKNRANDIIVVNEQFPIRFDKTTKLIDVYEKPNGSFDGDRLNGILNGTLQAPKKFYTDVWSIAYKPQRGQWTVFSNPESLSSTFTTSKIAGGYQLDVHRTHSKGILDVTYKLLDGKYSKPTVSFTNDPVNGFTNTKVVPVNILRGVNASSFFNENGVNILDGMANDTTITITKNQLDSVNKKFINFKDSQGNTFYADLTLGYNDLLAIQIFKNSLTGLYDITIAFDQVTNIGLGQKVTIDPQYHYDTSSTQLRYYDTGCNGVDSKAANDNAPEVIGADCARSYIEHDVTSIPDYADIIQVDAVYPITAVTGMAGDVIDIMPMTTTSSDADATVWTDLGDGTPYVNDSTDFQTATTKTITFGSSANSDLESSLQSDKNVFVHGLKFDNEAMGGTSYPTITNTGIELHVTYTLPKPTVAAPTASDDNPNQVTLTMSGTANGHGDSILGYYPEKNSTANEWIPQPTTGFTNSPESYFKFDNVGSGKEDTASVQYGVFSGGTPKFYYDFSNANGVTNLGSGGATFDLTNTGATTGSTGILDQAYNFDGINDEENANSSALTDWKFLHNSGYDYSISVWINPDDVTGNQAITATTNGNISDEGFLLYLSGNNIVALHQTGTTVLSHTSTGTITPNQWTHIVVTQDETSNTNTIYINGVGESISLNKGATTSPESKLAVGEDSSSGLWFDGDIDELAIYDGTVLTTSEVQQLYNNGAGLDPTSDSSFPQLTLKAGTEHYDVVDTQPTAEAIFGLNNDKTIDDFTTYTTQAEADTDWTPEDATYVKVDITTDKISLDSRYSTSVHSYLAHDFASGDYSGGDYVLREKIRFDSFGGTGASVLFMFGMSESDETISCNTNQAHDMLIISKQGEGVAVSSNDGTCLSSGLKDTSFSFTTGVDYYGELARVGNIVTATIYSDSGYSIPLGSISITSTATNSKFDTIKFANVDWDITTVNGDFTGSIDDVEFYDNWDGHISKIGGSVYLDGSTYYDTATEEEATYDLDYNDAKTFSFWVHPPNLTADNYIINKGSSATLGYSLYLDSSEKVNWKQISSTGNYELCTSTNALTQNAWSLVTVTESGSATDCSDVNIYINGVDETEVNSSAGTLASTLNNNDVRIGANFDGSTIVESGVLLDDLRIYNYELTSGQVTTLSGYTSIQSSTTWTDTSASDGDTYRYYAINEVNLSDVSSTVSCAYASLGNSDCSTDEIATAGTGTITKLGNIGDTVKIDADFQITAMDSTILPGTVNSYKIYENNTLMDTQPITGVTVSSVPQWVNGTVWHQIDLATPREVSVFLNVQNLTGTVDIKPTANFTITIDRVPTYFTATDPTEGLVNYTATRSADNKNVYIEINRNKDGDTFNVECLVQTQSQAIFSNNTGTWLNETGVGYYNETATGFQNSHLYGTCYNSGELFSFVSYTNSTLSLLGIQAFDTVYGDFIGVPVGIFFLVLLAGYANPRTAPIWLVVVLAAAGILAQTGFITLSNSIWALALVAGIFGLFVGRKFF